VKKTVSLEDISQLLIAEGIDLVDSSTYDHTNDRVFEVRLRGPARQFDVLRSALLSRDDVLGVYLD